MDPLVTLQTHFGLAQFRPLQAEIINHVLAGRDGLVLMPTGGGKSLCYQIPALVLEGVTLVISPLIALMKDQVEALHTHGINAAFVNSSQSNEEQDKIWLAAKAGALKLIYISPEKLFSGRIISFLQSMKVSLVAIDESHCISSWGHDFRPEYRQLKDIRTYFPQTPVLALTATADQVTRRDICQQVGIAEENIFLASFNRPNLSLQVLPGKRRMEQIFQILSARKDQPGIIYCLSRKGAEQVANQLQMAGYAAEYYHAGLSPSDRSRIQEAFLRDDCPILVATIAFGMGIDKSNIRWIIHYNLPGNLESYYQEIGRAGRDGEPADTFLFANFQDRILREAMWRDSNLPDDQKELLQVKFDRLMQYVQADVCRRRILLSYFQEVLPQDCGRCDVCQNPPKRIDGTIWVQKALSAIVRSREQLPMSTLVEVLRGQRTKQVVQAGWDKIKTFGQGRDLTTDKWMDVIHQCLHIGLLDVAYDHHHCLRLTALAWEVLKGERTVELATYRSAQERLEAWESSLPAPQSHSSSSQALFERLRKVRKQIADSLSLAPYQIFSDATIRELAEKAPQRKSEFERIPGISQEKYRRFGDIFLQEICQFHQKETGNRVKGSTYQATWELYTQGMSVAEISEARQINTSTILLHLIRLHESGKSIDFSPWIQPEEIKTIADVAVQLGLGQKSPMKPLFEHFEGAFSYDQIRMALVLGL